MRREFSNVVPLKRAKKAPLLVDFAVVIAMSVIIGAGIGAAPHLSRLAAAPTEANAVEWCRVVDGDTLRCGNERVRLLGIDAPELPGHCRIGRACAPGDPYASTASLQ